MAIHIAGTWLVSQSLSGDCLAHGYYSFAMTGKNEVRQNRIELGTKKFKLSNNINTSKRSFTNLQQFAHMADFSPK